MRDGSKSFILGITLVLFLMVSNGMQTQGATWVSYGSMYGYTEREYTIRYDDNGRMENEYTSSDSFNVWNLNADGDKLYFRTNYTPYFMGLQNFESQEEFDTYLAEHYLYDNETDSMVLAYSVVGTQFLFVDVVDTIVGYNATLSDFDIRLLHTKLYGLFLPVNHQSFSFEADYLTSLFSERPTENARFEQGDSFVLDKMEYTGYYVSLEYKFYKTYPDFDARFEYELTAGYSTKGELYSFVISEWKYNVDTNKKMDYYEISRTLDTIYRVGGVKHIDFVSSLVILCSLSIIALVVYRHKK